MIRALCYHGIIASVIVLVLGTPARAQDATPDRSGAPAPAQEAAPDRKADPAPAQEAASDRKAEPASAQEAPSDHKADPAPAQEAESDRKADPAPAQEAESDRKADPAPAQEAAPDRKAEPAPAQKAAPDRKAEPASVQEAAPDRKAEPAPARGAADRMTRTPEKDAAADRNTPKPAKDAEPDHFRGVITRVDASSIVMKTGDGKTVRLRLPDNLTIIALTKGSFTAVDFGVYVGAAAVRLEQYSPIVRDSLSWLHKGFELRIIDEQLRGIALGHKKWDLTPDSIIAHGWIDDIEGRVISIKWGPTELEETDVETPRGAPVLKMSLGDKSLIKAGAHVLAGAEQGTAAFIFVGQDGVVPPL